MLQVLIPCAGSGRRFAAAGYADPKPLVGVGGRPMLRRVVENVRPAGPHRWVFAARPGWVEAALAGWAATGPRAVVELTAPTDGAARTCLLAAPELDPAAPLLVCNCDQLVLGGIAPLLETAADSAVLTTAGGGDPKWSYALTAGPLVARVVEKPITPPASDRATTGHYWFRRAGDFFAAVRCMIALDDRVNGEVYVAPAVNYLIAAGRPVAEVRVEGYGGVFAGLGTPADLAAFLASPGAAALET